MAYHLSQLFVFVMYQFGKRFDISVYKAIIILLYYSKEKKILSTSLKLNYYCIRIIEDICNKLEQWIGILVESNRSKHMK